jgi:hypothetical protein
VIYIVSIYIYFIYTLPSFKEPKNFVYPGKRFLEETNTRVVSWQLTPGGKGITILSESEGSLS